jgi:hypothetical protein
MFDSNKKWKKNNMSFIKFNKKCNFILKNKSKIVNYNNDLNKENLIKNY